MYTLFIPKTIFNALSSSELLEISKFTLTHEPPNTNYFAYDSSESALKSLIWIGPDTNARLSLDFVSEKMLWRYHKINKSQEPILRAIGWKSNRPLHLLDLTAGLGRDSAMMAAAGVNVTMIERNPILQILLESGLSQLKHASNAAGTQLSDRLHLIKMDAIDYLKNVLNPADQIPPDPSHQYDVIYMDPMFPHRKKSALVKLDLRMVRELVGDDPDAHILLEWALKTSCKRIVVKRPKNAPQIGNLTPHHTVESPNMRFDIYQNL